MMKDLTPNFPRIFRDPEFSRIFDDPEFLTPNFLASLWFREKRIELPGAG
jgi:hypothetical protein